MSDNLLSDIKGYLIAQGISSTGLTYGDEPDTPVECTVLHEYAGRPPAKTHTTTSQRPGLQVSIRSRDWATGRARLQAIEDILDGLQNVSISATDYISIEAIQGVVPLGWSPEAGGRVIRLAQNYQIERAR